MKTSINTIIFDLGGVLIDWNPRYMYRTLFGVESEMEDFLRTVCHHEWNEKQDAGRPFAEATEELVVAHPEKEKYIRAYFDRWPEMLGGAIEGTAAILEALHKKKEYRLLALSNWSAETFPFAQERFPFLGYFETVLLSGTEKLIKPDPRFFQLLQSRLHVDFSKSVFIDDVQKNIDGALALNLNTIHFKSPVQLTTELRDRFGVLVS
jgi:2-haloacid dehalogenase